MNTATTLERLTERRQRRLAEDERLVCCERARLLAEAREGFGALPRVPRQAAVLRHLCAGVTPVVEPGDVLLGRLPEVLPSPEEEEYVAAHLDLFNEPGLPGVLDSLSIFIPDWDWLIEQGLGGIAAVTRERLQRADTPGQREYLAAAVEALEAVALLLQRYAAAAREVGLAEAADRCERVAHEAPSSFADALQLLAMVHLVLSYLVGGRDVTPGRMDQYLLPLYRADLTAGRLDREEAVALLAHFCLGLSHGAGNATDFDDNVRRSPCKYSHLYVTLGGCDAQGRPADNELSLALLDAIRLLQVKEPTLCLRHRADLSPAFRERAAALIADRFPVTVYNDEVVQEALVTQGVPRAAARGFAHSACHNVIVVGHEAGSGPSFCNLPLLVLRALAQADSCADFEAFFALLMQEVRGEIEATAAGLARRWQAEYEPACPLLQSALYRFCLERAAPAWQAAPVAHFNLHLMGLATTVNSLLVLQELVFGSGEVTLEELRAALAEDWVGHEVLQAQVRGRVPRYGQDDPAALALTARLGRMWVEEVERVGAGRPALWPGFYSHVVHVHQGAHTPATPDGRRDSEALSENQSPAPGTTGCSPTSVLRTMELLPYDHTPSGAGTMALPVGAAGPDDADVVDAVLRSYFDAGGLHLHLNVLDATVLTDALARPERHPDLMVRVAGYSAYFVRLSPEVQRDVVRRLVGG